MPETLDQFDDIVAALREDRPVIDPAFARELDQRAAAGFPRKRRRRFALPAIAWVGLPAAAVASLVVVVAVIGGGVSDDSGSGGGGSSSASSGGVAASPQTGAKQAQNEVQQLSRESSADASRRAAPPAFSASAQLRGRVQEQTAGLTLVAAGRDLAELGDRVIATTDQVGGFVMSSSVSTSSGGDYQLRVPVARLDEALARLSKLGHVSQRTQGSQDITAQRNVARDRYDEAVAERRSLLARLGRATTDNEVASLKARLDDVNGRIAVSQAALERVLRRARFASVSVTLQPKRGALVPADDGKWTPGDALDDAGRVLEVAAGVVVVVGSVLLPLALLALLAALAHRSLGRRGRARALESV